MATLHHDPKVPLFLRYTVILIFVSVMLHELSHIRSMTHGPLFWKTYNILKKDMAELDAKGYTGEGFYSRPYTLDGTVPLTRTIAEDEIPENICGGSWQRETRRRRRRKTGGRKKKFKGEGVRIGEDEEKRKNLEGGKVGKKVFSFWVWLMCLAEGGQVEES